MRSQRLINLRYRPHQVALDISPFTRGLCLPWSDPGRIRPSGRCRLVQPNSQCQQMGRSKDYKPMIQKMQWVNQLVKTVALNPQKRVLKAVLVPGNF